MLSRTLKCFTIPALYACALLYLALLLAPSQAVAQDETPQPSDPGRIAVGTWVTFGQFQRDPITDITGLILNKDYVVYNGQYFAMRPILWRVVATHASDPTLEENEVLLLSRDVLTARLDFSRGVYGGTPPSVNWDVSDMRAWLNGISDNSPYPPVALEFLSTGHFSGMDYSAIVPKIKATQYGTQLLGPALSRVYPLSVSELNAYGFPNGPALIARSTPYSQFVQNGTTTLGPLGYWSRTSQSPNSQMVDAISDEGWPTQSKVNAQGTFGARPAMAINLTKVHFTFDSNGNFGDGTENNPYPLTGTPGDPDSPTSSFHMGFTTSTSKCYLCHSAHRAAGYGEYLLPLKANVSCSYCHIDTSLAYTNLQVYGGKLENYISEPTTSGAHYMIEVAGGYTGTTCVDCHYVHRSSGDELDKNRYTAHPVLQAVQSSDPGASEYTLNPVLPTDSKNVALSKWCIKCHPISEHTGHEIFPPGDPSAPEAVSACMSCHNAEYNTPEWPHFAEGAEKFLLIAENTTAETEAAQSVLQDGTCLRCHRAAQSPEIRARP